MADLDVGEMHEAALGLMVATQKSALVLALDKLHDVGSRVNSLSLAEGKGQSVPTVA